MQFRSTNTQGSDIKPTWLVMAALAMLCLVILSDGISSVDLTTQESEKTATPASVSSPNLFAESPPIAPFRLPEYTDSIALFVLIIFSFMIFSRSKSVWLRLLLLFGIYLVLVYLSTLPMNWLSLKWGSSRPPNEESPIIIPTILPEWLIRIASMVIALLLASLMVFGIILAYQRIKQKPAPPLIRVQELAKRTIHSIGSGEDFRQVVLRCYQELELVLEKEKGILRKSTMTPHEFKDALYGMGFPFEPVEGLTKLFEEVRYGDKSPSKESKDRMIQYLESIVTFCK